MASSSSSSNPLEEILNSEVDESAINAVVGSLESSLCSPPALKQGPTISNHTTTPQSHLGPNSKGLLNSSSSQHNAKPMLPSQRTEVSRASPANSPNVANAKLNNHNGTNSTEATVNAVSNPIGSTNVGTVSSVPAATAISSKPLLVAAGANNNIHNVAADQKPVVVPTTVDAKPPLGLPGHLTTIKTEPDVKPPVVFNVVRPSMPQNTVIKPEVKFVPQAPGVMNAVVSSGLKTSTLTPASTSVITLTRPMSTPQTVTVVRQPIAVQTPAHTSGSSLQIVSMANSVMTPRAVTSTAVQKTLAPRAMPMQTAPVRIAANPQQVLPARPQSNANAITINQPIPPGMVLVRDPQGQIVMVQGQVPQTGSPVPTSQPVRVQSVRLTSAPATQVIQPHPSQVSTPQAVIRPQASPAQMSIRHPMIAPVVATSANPGSVTTRPIAAPGMVTTQPTTMAAVPRGAAPAGSKQDDLENVRKCKNFLSTLLRLAASQPASTVRNVRNLIQGLIESRVDPENFTQQLQVELQSSPQPYLVPFLKATAPLPASSRSGDVFVGVIEKSLPLLRQSMISGKMKIEGIQAPNLQALRGAPVAQVQQPQLGMPAGRGAIPTNIRPVQYHPPVRPVVPGAGVRPGTIIQPHQQQQQRPMVMVQQQHCQRLPHHHQQQQQQQQQQQPPRGIASALAAKSAAAKAKTPTALGAAGPKGDKRKYDSLKDDDDINDVATMGGVNLTEESRNILATSSELLTGQMRSCKEEVLLSPSALRARLNATAKRHGLEDMSPEVVNLISHATEVHLRYLLEKLAVASEHRLEIYKLDKRYEVGSEVRPQIRFLEDLDKIEKKRHEEAERVVLLRAAKSRSKHEDPEHLKLKEKARAMQQAELEQERQREANLTALAAIGPRKKRKVDGSDGNATSPGSSSLGGIGSSGPRPAVHRPRIKRVNIRDLLFVLEQERQTNKSNLLYKTYLK